MRAAMNKPRPQPQRMCVACRRMRDKSALLRLVRSPQGEIGVDSNGKAPGRGAYLCNDPACLAKARKTRALERALHCQINEETWSLLSHE